MVVAHITMGSGNRMSLIGFMLKLVPASSMELDVFQNDVQQFVGFMNKMIN